MASIKAYIGKDGNISSYRFRACIGRDEKGRQKFASKTVPIPVGLTPKKAEKELQRQADEWEQKLRKGIAPISSTSFEHFVENDWWHNFVLNGEHKKTTVEFYRNMKGRIVEHLGAKKLDAVRSVDIERFLIDLRNEGLSPATVKHYQTVLRVIFGYAERHDMVERNPMRKVSPVKQDAKQVDFLKPEEAKEFLRALGSAPPLWRCMMLVLILCGVRRGEAVGLKWSDIDFDSGTISISRAATYTGKAGVVTDTPKSSSSVRVIQIPKVPVSVGDNTTTLKAVLQDWKITQEEQFGKFLPSAFVFSSDRSPYTPMFPTTPTRWLARFVKAHNLPDVSPHDLRHTCGALMLASGAASIKDVQATLGHEDAATTLRFYAGTTPETLQKAADGLASMLG